MEILRKSPLTGNLNVMDINVTDGQLKAWESGTLIQVAMPHLTPEEREFIMTGYTPEDWRKVFG